MSLSPPWKFWFAGSIPFKNELNFSRESMCLMLLLSEHMVFFEKCVRFVHSTELAYLDQNHPFSTLKSMFCRKCSSQKRPQFTMENNMLDAARSSIHACLWRGAWVSSPELNRPIWIKESLYSLWNIKVAGSTLAKTTTILTGKQWLLATASNRNPCVLETHVLLPRSWRGLLGKKWAFIHHETSVLQEVFLQTLLQFSLGNNWVDAPASSSRGFLLEDTCVSSSQPNWPIWCNQRRYPDW
jgi:hypothetical protein